MDKDKDNKTAPKQAKFTQETEALPMALNRGTAGTKRSYSPSIDDIRQYNIKKQRLLDDLDSLTLETSSPRSTPQPVSTRDKEFIPDIDDFLIHNQDDQDILENYSHVIDMDHHDRSNLIIPTKITNLHNLTRKDAQFSFDRIVGRKKYENRFNRFNGNVQITNEDILWDHEILKHWSLIKYWKPDLMLYQIWENWYVNVFKLGQFDSYFYNDRIEFLPDDYNGPIHLDNRTNEDNDVMIDDYEQQDATNIEHGDHGDYYGNIQTTTTTAEEVDDVPEGHDDDAMDID